MLADNADAIERVLAMEPGAARHPIADVRDDLVQAANIIAYCREVLGEALTVHLQTASNRLNQIATRGDAAGRDLVPLTLITSYFGQNFAWLTDHVDSLEAFLIWGVGAIIVPAAGTWLWLRRAATSTATASSVPRAPAPVRGATKRQRHVGSGTVDVDLTQVAHVDTQPGELPATMAAWVIRQEREGEPVDAFQVEEIEVPNRARSRSSCG